MNAPGNEALNAVGEAQHLANSDARPPLPQRAARVRMPPVRFGIDEFIY